MPTIHIHSVQDINVNLLDAIKNMYQGNPMTIKIEIDEDTQPVFTLSENQKYILDSQKDLPLSYYQDADELLKELKETYGL